MRHHLPLNFLSLCLIASGVGTLYDLYRFLVSPYTVFPAEGPGFMMVFFPAALVFGFLLLGLLAMKTRSVIRQNIVTLLVLSVLALLISLPQFIFGFENTFPLPSIYDSLDRRVFLPVILEGIFLVSILMQLFGKGQLPGQIMPDRDEREHLVTADATRKGLLIGMACLLALMLFIFLVPEFSITRTRAYDALMIVFAGQYIGYAVTLLRHKVVEKDS